MATKQIRVDLYRNDFKKTESPANDVFDDILSDLGIENDDFHLFTHITLWANKGKFSVRSY